MLKGMKRLAPIRHSWTCRASLSRQHYTMNTVILCQICLAFGLPFCPISMSYCFQTCPAMCTTTAYCIGPMRVELLIKHKCLHHCFSMAHRVEHIESSSAKALKFQLPFMGQCQNLHSQQVPVPNLTNVCSATVLWEASNCQATWTTNRMRWSAKTYSMKSQLIWQEPYHTLPNLQQRSS